MIALSELGVSVAVLAAPMSGGPATPALVVAAADAGSLGFLAGGYKSAQALADQIDEVRARTAAFGVNLFAPNPVPVDRTEYDHYRERLRADAERFGAPLPEIPVEDDDQWRDKIDVLLDKPVPIVSFTFGLPDSAALAALRGAGTSLVQTVTSADEARLAADAGVDALVVQASAAGGHSATFTPDRIPVAKPLPGLLAEIQHAVPLPVFATGGLADPGTVAEAIGSGARAVLVGTALLLAPEAGTSAVYRRALAGPDRGDTVVTRSFSGRPARGLRNTFIDTYDPLAPAGYPAVHYLTSPLRRAAVEAGDPEYVNLWAGVGYRATVAQPARDTLLALAVAL
jgi:NAD(P)H-dependent flavin oxidoreductase YrpB (nitropropane dioxygenase family)